MTRFASKLKKPFLFFIILVLTINTFPPFYSAVAESEVDYEYEFYLPADGSEDEGLEYQVVRDDEEKEGYMYISADISEKSLHVSLENVREVHIYFNETNIELDEHISRIRNLISVEIDVIVDSDVSLLNATFHEVPDASDIQLNGGVWEEYEYQDGVLQFEDLQMSENTITLVYTGIIQELMPAMVVLVFSVFFIIQTKKLFMDSFSGD